MLIPLLTSVLMLTGIAAVMLWMNWVLALMVFFLNPLFLAFSRLLGRKTGELFRKQNEAYQLYQEPHYPHLSNPFEGLPATSVELKNISFAYGNGKQVLHDISLKVEAGQKIALIGPSGSGKTTIAQIMVGLLPFASRKDTLRWCSHRADRPSCGT